MPIQGEKGTATKKEIALKLKELKPASFMQGFKGLGSNGNGNFQTGENQPQHLPDKTPLGVRTQKGMAELLGVSYEK